MSSGITSRSSTEQSKWTTCPWWVDIRVLSKYVQWNRLLLPLLLLLLLFSYMAKVKVRCTLVQALRLCTSSTAHKGSRGIALLFLDHATIRSEGSASRAGRSLPPGKTRYPLYRRLGGPQGRSGQVRKISPPPPGFDPRTVQPVAQSLYWLSYRAHIFVHKV